MPDTIAIEELKELLKDAYLTVAKMDLHITENTSKSDVQSLTASKFRQVVLDKIEDKR